MYTVRLLRREEVARGTRAFYFEKPEGFGFRPGQYLTLALIDPPETDAEGNRRDFSIASAPKESHLMVATRMRNTAFKRVLGGMPIGGEIQVEGPAGSFLLHNDASRPAVFLAGGIGITPFRSMAENAAQAELPHRIFLFYSSRTPEDAPFLKELAELENANPRFKLIATMTETPARFESRPPAIARHERTGSESGGEKSAVPWEGERGRIDKTMLEKCVGSLSGPIYYVAGPPLMALNLRAMLNGAGIDDDDIRSEEFSGY